jgi:hypothetical protein
LLQDVERLPSFFNCKPWKQEFMATLHFFTLKPSVFTDSEGQLEALDRIIEGASENIAALPVASDNINMQEALLNAPNGNAKPGCDGALKHKAYLDNSSSK